MALCAMTLLGFWHGSSDSGSISYLKRHEESCKACVPLIYRVQGGAQVPSSGRT